jgi:hypothetical protein
MITKEFYMKTIQKTAVTLAVSSLFSTGAFAQAAPAAPEVSPVTANVTVVSDYRYRGLTQSNFKPAIQGGFDYAHESGFYIGNWNSSISWISDGYGAYGYPSTKTVSAPVEMDFYAGFKKELIGEGFATDVGVLQYYYPTSGFPSMNLPRNSSHNANNATLSAAGTRQSAGVSPNTTELYAAQNFAFGPTTGFIKFSYAVTPIFGIYNSAGSYYPDLTVNHDTGFSGITLNAHVGYQKVTNTSGVYDFSYTDWKLGLTKDFGGGLSSALAYVGTTAKTVANTPIYASPTNANMGKGGFVASLTKTF